MSDPKHSETEVSQALVTIILWVSIPVGVLVAIAYVAHVLGPALPFVLIGAVALAILYLWYRYKGSAAGVRVAHERALLSLIEQAEEQQRALPRVLDDEQLIASLARRRIAVDGSLRRTIIDCAQTMYAEEFLAPLPANPGVPLHGDIIVEDYDRRTLKKGEEPPSHERTDSRGRPTTPELFAFESHLERYCASTVRVDATLSLFVATFADLVKELLQTDSIGAQPSMLSVPLVDVVPDAKQRIEKLLEVVSRPSVRAWHHFSSLRATYERNRQQTSEVNLRVRDLSAGVRLDPSAFSGSARDTVDLYLRGSPLRSLFYAPVPFTIPAERRFEGQLVVARQGAGKTNALECLIYDDLAEVAAGRASIVVMDSQGLGSDALIGRLSRLQYFAPGGPLADRLTYLEPDLDWPLALNIFDIGVRDLGSFSPAEREAVVTSACDVVEFLFTGILGGELSDNMTMLYRYLVPAMLAIPNADMRTFIELLDSGERGAAPLGFEKHRAHFASLDSDIRSFLETDYLRDPELVKTKAAVRRRLRATLADTHFRKMFSQPRNRLNLFDELQTGRVILVNTFPAGNYVEQFGRLILALLMQATHRRLSLDRDARKPTYVYLDECQDYIAKEDRIAKYIDKCRKQNVGLIFATQRLGTIESPRVLNALSGVPIKFVGSNDADASELAGMVGAPADHIRRLPRGTFATHVSGVTASAIDVTFPESPLKAAATVGRDAFEAMRTRMRERYAAQPVDLPAQAAATTIVRELRSPSQVGDDYDPFTET